MRRARRRAVWWGVLAVAGVLTALTVWADPSEEEGAPARGPEPASSAAPAGPEASLASAFTRTAPAASPGPASAAPPAAAPAAAATPAAPSHPVPGVSGDATVLGVVELTVLDVLVAGDVYRVRLAGFALPDVWGVVQCYGEEARTVVERLAPPGSSLTLEAAGSDGLLPSVYAWSGETLLNARIVEIGYGLVRESGSRGVHAAALLEAQSEAARTIAGLWGAAVGIDSYRGGVECESLSGFFSAAHVGTASLLEEGVPHGRLGYWLP